MSNSESNDTTNATRATDSVDAEPVRSGSENTFDGVTSSAASDGTMTPGPSTPGLSATTTPPSYPVSAQDQEDLDAIPPLDRITIFDFLENLALPQRIERLQYSISTQTDKVRRQQQKLRLSAKQKVVDEWRKRVPPPDEQLDKYRKRMRTSVDRLGRRWSDAKTVTNREKLSFIAGVLNIFISGYLVGAYPQYFHWWYTAQLSYFYPIRFWTYHKRGYHYFLVDLCYFVNLLLILSIWVFPQSKRLFISTFCLAFGNNAVAIAMWRNSMVFHSLDKVTSLFIHIMPCVTLHCLVHLIPSALQKARFPAIYNIKYSSPTSPEHYSLAGMIVWVTVPYAVWQLSYHFLITVRKREKIEAGRPTSFTWLRKSYANTFLGKFVLARPEHLQEATFMLIQYVYALLTMMPAPIWFWFRWPSAGFLMTVFTWSVYNGAVYYIDIFGTRFQKELDQLKRDVAKWQTSPEIAARTPLMTPSVMTPGDGGNFDDPSGYTTIKNMTQLSLGDAATSDSSGGIADVTARSDGAVNGGHTRASSDEGYSLVDKNGSDENNPATTGAETKQQPATEGLRERS